MYIFFSLVKAITMKKLFLRHIEKKTVKKVTAYTKFKLNELQLKKHKQIIISKLANIKKTIRKSVTWRTRD